MCCSMLTYDCCCTAVPHQCTSITTQRRYWYARGRMCWYASSIQVYTWYARRSCTCQFRYGLPHSSLSCGSWPYVSTGRHTAANTLSVCRCKYCCDGFDYGPHNQINVCSNLCLWVKYWRTWFMEIPHSFLCHRSHEYVPQNTYFLIFRAPTAVCIAYTKV